VCASEPENGPNSSGRDVRQASNPVGTQTAKAGGGTSPSRQDCCGPELDRKHAMTTRPKLWVPGDWSAFFGFGTNILVNLLTLTALLRFVLKIPDDFVFGRILPATGLMLCLSTLYYAWLA